MQTYHCSHVYSTLNMGASHVKKIIRGWKAWMFWAQESVKVVA